MHGRSVAIAAKSGGAFILASYNQQAKRF